MSKRFAIVYDEHNSILRLIDTSDDPDDSHLEWVKKTIAPGHTMETFPCGDHPEKLPRLMEAHIGKGEVAVKIAPDAKPMQYAMMAPTPVEPAPLTDEEKATAKARWDAWKAAQPK